MRVGLYSRVLCRGNVHVCGEVGFDWQCSAEMEPFLPCCAIKIPQKIMKPLFIFFS